MFKPVSLSLVKLTRIESNILHVQNLDVLDGTPLLDIMPYVAAFEETADLRTGWLEQNKDKLRRL